MVMLVLDAVCSGLEQVLMCVCLSLSVMSCNNVRDLTNNTAEFLHRDHGCTHTCGPVLSTSSLALVGITLREAYNENCLVLMVLAESNP